MQIRLSTKPSLALKPESKVGAVCMSSARMDLCGVVSRTCSKGHDAVSEIKEGPSQPACRSRLQTTLSCCCPMAVVVNITEKVRLRLRHVLETGTDSSVPPAKTMRKMLCGTYATSVCLEVPGAYCPDFPITLHSAGQIDRSSFTRSETAVSTWIY